MIGRTVSHYEIREALGGGAMGRVFKAWDTRNECWRALKFLPNELAHDEASLQRFVREAHTASSLEHGHICTIYEMDQDQDGTWFIAMAYYEGHTLTHCLRDGPMPATSAIEYARQIALGLAAAHRHGIVHRDIKPDNIIITEDNEAVILDFGIAHLIDDVRLTQPGHQTGTLAYMAPEMIQGGAPSPQVDIWSLGVLLFELLTGTLPYEAKYTAALMYSITYEAPRALPETFGEEFGGIRRILDLCLAKDPLDRYESAADLVQDLNTAVHNPGLISVTRPTTTRRRRWGRRLAFAVTASVLVLASVIVTLITHPQLDRLDRQGVAILPFGLEGDDEAAHLFGEGLSWLVADQLAQVESKYSDFWIVPPDDICRFEIQNGQQALDRLGVRRTFRAYGTLKDTTVDLRLEYIDGSGNPPIRQSFTSEIANLNTWQYEIAAWCLAQLDPDSEGIPVQAWRLGTQVPEAFRDYLTGLAWERRFTGLDTNLRRAHQIKARDLLSSAVQSDSSFAVARAELGHVLWGLYSSTDTILANTGIDQLEVSSGLSPSLTRPHYYLGLIAAERGNTEQALTDYDRVLRYEPDHKQALLARAKLSIALGQNEEANRSIQQMLDARPGYVVDLLEAGRLYWTQGNTDQTVKYWRTAADIAPRSFRAQNYMGAALFEFHDDPLAESYFLKALAIRKDYTTYSNLGTWYYYHNLYQNARVQYLKAFDLGQVHEYQLMRNLAETYRWSPGYEDSVTIIFDRARLMAEQQLAASPDNTSLKADLATIYSVLGDTIRTLEILAGIEAIEMDRNTDFMISVAWEDMGKRNKALVRLEQALGKGLRLTRVDGYPGFRNLRADARYAKITAAYR